MNYYFAPMEGITDSVYRRNHSALFPGIGKYFSPFISPTMHHKMTGKELRDVLPRENGGLFLVPQILTKSGADFRWAARELGDMGYREVNLNLGCPSGTVTAKGKGAGLLADPYGLRRFLEEIFADPPVKISVKTRLGVEDPKEFEEILNIYNDFPILELTIHPRVRRDMYRAPVRMEDFARALQNSKNPVCYNGNLNTAGQVRAFSEKFPQVEAVMLGRGLIADPALAAKCRGLPWGGKEALREFHDRLMGEYRQVFGSDRNAMFRMKEVWGFHHRLFRDSDKLWKRLRKATDLGEYRAVTEEIYRELELLPETDAVW